MALLEVRDLTVSFDTEDGVVQAVDDVSYSLDRGQALGIVGESGSGKSVSSLTVMGLTRFDQNARISGEVLLDGKNLLTASDDELRRLRGNDMAMIFQDPLSSLHPFYKIGDQLVEAVQAHRDVSKAQALDRAVEMLGLVGIPDPRRRIDGYPHEFSGGMRQRVMIAMGLINDPKLLIADEPTTALDVTVQAQILELIARLQHELDTAIVLITHDLGVVAEVTDEIAVMYAGKIVERGPRDPIFADPQHPYTWGLLGSIPRLDQPREAELVPIPGRPPSLIHRPPGCAFHPRCPYVQEKHKEIVPPLKPSGGRSAAQRGVPAAGRPAARAVERAARRCEARGGARRGGRRERRPAGRDRRQGGGMSTTPRTLVEARDVEMHFPLKSGVILQRDVGAVRAVDGVSFDVYEGETLGIVGESGCGKSTTARVLMRLLEPTAGSVSFEGQDITHLTRREMLPLRREMQMIFQDPYSSLDPRQTVGSVIGEPFVIHGIERDDDKRKRLVQELMEQVGLNPEHYNRLPHQFSGGQRQRIGVARAIALKPKLVIADEPVSALDVSIQAQIINLLRDLQRELGLTIVFIAHDLSVVRHMCDRVAVMYLGKIVELADADDLFAHPRHPYTGALLGAVPVPDPQLAKLRRRNILVGDVPSPTAPPPGCRFHTRCPKAQGKCSVDEPPMEPKQGGNLAACHFPLADGELDQSLPTRAA